MPVGIYMIIHKKSPPSSNVPSLSDMIIMVASLGGYIRKKDCYPGVKTLWLGMQRMYDFATAWDTFHKIRNTA